MREFWHTCRRIDEIAFDHRYDTILNAPNISLPFDVQALSHTLTLLSDQL
jgi:hypothetical protein